MKKKKIKIKLKNKVLMKCQKAEPKKSKCINIKKIYQKNSKKSKKIVIKLMIIENTGLVI